MKQGSGSCRWMTVLFLTGFVLPLMTGTTYIVLEGEKEVGRYEDHDGSPEVKYVKREKPGPARAVREEAGPRVSPRSLESFGKKFLDFKIEDPDLIRFLNRQPWMIQLRAWDKQYGLEETLGRYRPFFVFAVLGLLFLMAVLAALRLLRRLTKITSKS